VALEAELATYRKLWPSLVQRYLGKQVLIQGDRLVGAYQDYAAAFGEAVRLFGTGPFLIREVRDPEPVETV
jgi:hypothetical protein